MALVHEKLDQSSDLARVECVEYARSLHLVQMLAGQLHATVEISHSEGAYFAFTFEEP